MAALTVTATTIQGGSPVGSNDSGAAGYFVADCTVTTAGGGVAGQAPWSTLVNGGAVVAGLPLGTRVIGLLGVGGAAAALVVAGALLSISVRGANVEFRSVAGNGALTDPTGAAGAILTLLCARL